MTFKTFGISGFRIFAYKFFFALTTSLKRTVNSGIGLLLRHQVFPNQSSLSTVIESGYHHQGSNQHI
jgi:hypothetical protein